MSTMFLFTYLQAQSVSRLQEKNALFRNGKKCDKHSDLKHFLKDVNILANKTRNVGYASCKLTFNLIFSHIIRNYSVKHCK